MHNIVIASFSYATFQLLAGYGAQKLSDLWFLTISTISLVLFTGLLIGYQVYKGNNFGDIHNYGGLAIFVSGGFITLFTLYLGRSYQTFDTKFVIPMLFGLAILVGTLVSFAISKTMPTSKEIISLLLISGGLILLSTQKS